jgi:calcium-dependent protein kinase
VDECSDLKPENVLLTGPSLTSTIKVIDFGRSTFITPRQQLTEFTGSVSIIRIRFLQLHYMAPEVVSNSGYNEACDIWSCGVISYLLLSGSPPFYEETKSKTIEAIMAGYVNMNSTHV